MKTTRQTDPTLAVAYIRVSTDDQNLAPEAQRASIDAWAARQGCPQVSQPRCTQANPGHDLVATTALELGAAHRGR